MAKKIFPITKYRFTAVAVSAVLLIAGIVCFALLDGFNLGIDFQSGFSQRVQIAPAAVSVVYTGSDTVTLDVSSGDTTLVVRDGSGSKYLSFTAEAYPTVGELAAGLTKQVPGVTATAIESSLATSGIITGFGLPATLSTTPLVLNSANTDTASYISIDEMRKALGASTQVQVVGDSYRQVFQIKLGNDGNASEADISASVQEKLSTAFGDAKVVTLQTDFVGPKFSSSLITGSILTVVVAIAMILLYVWFRFKLSYALASIITLCHDTLLLVAFIVVFQLEVSSTTIAALLTIIGYTLNNVIVIFDRIRENKPILKDMGTRDLIDTSVSQSLTRTLFSSLTTILAILPLAILATGSIQLFAIELTFGILVGAYSCNFIAPSLYLWISKKTSMDKKLVVEAAASTSVPATTSAVETVEKAASTVEDAGIPTAERKLKGKRQQKK
ncbi:MAG: protein translocase subunit SecF [Sphaerochaetaceae bacterium]